MGSLRTVQFGKSGEDLACAELVRRGYAILARRFRTRFGEIDIVASDGPVLVFVEVKARSGTRFGVPAEAVTLWKQQRIIAMARMYLVMHRRPPGPIRFDVVSVLALPGCAPVIDVIRGAFTA